MLTLFLCTAANTLSRFSGPFEYLGWALYGVAILHAAAAALEARNSPSRAALGQFTRCLATIAAPTFTLTSPFVHFTTLGALLFREVTLSPAILAVCAQAALLCACLAKGGLDAIQSARHQASASVNSAPRGKVMAQTDARAGSHPAEVQSQIEDLALRLAILEDRLQQSTREHVAETEPETTESPFDAAAAALAQMGYHDGPWNAQKTVDTLADNTPDGDAPAEDQYPPVSNDADFLKVMERP